MRARSLSTVLRNAVSYTVAATAACGGGSSTTGTSSGVLPEGMTSLCDPKPANVYDVKGFQPGTPADYIAYRSESLYWIREADAGADAGPETSATMSVASEKGTKCAGAADKAACTKKLDELRIYTEASCPRGTQINSGNRGGSGRSGMYVVYTRGDDVVVINTREALVSFLAPIDTPEEALEMARQDGSGMKCPGAGYRTTSGGFELALRRGDECRAAPEGGIHDVIVLVRPDGSTEIVSRTTIATSPGCAEGRRPCGLRVSKKRARSGVGLYFARAAHLEAASVVAFAQLERELRALGAPAALVTRVRAARRDEVRHAKATTKLAKRFGAKPRSVSVRPFSPRRALAIAIENAREGCVRETLGAAIALHRAERATDPEVARAMKAIAEDELRHAQLSWDMAAWLDLKLTARGRAAVERAVAKEIALLRREIDGARSARDLETTAGAPAPEALRSLFTQIEREVWAA